MGEEQGLSAANLALVYRLEGDLAISSNTAAFMRAAWRQINPLLDAARSEGATFSGGVSLSSVPRSEGLQPVSVKGEGGLDSLGASKAPSCGSPTGSATPSGGWQSMETVPKYVGPVLLKLKEELPDRPDLINWRGRAFVATYQGKHSEWCFAAPVGHGGFPDEWFEGWAALPHSAPAAAAPIRRRSDDRDFG